MLDASHYVNELMALGFHVLWGFFFLKKSKYSAYLGVSLVFRAFGTINRVYLVRRKFIKVLNVSPDV